ncbi:hypothetical protein VUN82_16375 [Micrococcaceae bacterium Sec5.1]
MDWLIWVIVIVLIVAIVWWLLSRNNARNSSTGPLGTAPGTGTPGRTGTAAPAAMEPSDTMSMPDTAAAVAGVAGLAGVTNMGKAAAEGSGPVESSMESRVETEAQAGPPVDEPVIETPEVDEPVVDEPVVDTDAQVTAGDVDDWEAAGTPASEPLAAEPAISEPAASGSGDGVTADDVTRADDTPKVEESADTNAADKAEWESSWTDAGGTAIHHHEYTDAHSATLAGAETAAAEMDDEDSMTPTGHLAAEHPYGVGSASAAADGSGPEGYPVKADASTMTYHDEDTAGYDEATADVWFESAAHAEAAGFRPPPRNRH